MNLDLLHPPRILAQLHSVSCAGPGECSCEPILIQHSDLDDLTDAERAKLRNRLMRYVQVDEQGCWIWQAFLDKGYGRIYVGTAVRKGPRLAHRVLYELDRGHIPTGYQVDHLCRVPACVNPAHLEAVTPLVNTRRAPNPRRLKTHCPQGHPYDAENTRISHRGDGSPFRSCHICSLDGLHRRRRAKAWARKAAGQ